MQKSKKSKCSTLSSSARKDNPKRAQLEEEKQVEIDKGNVLLLQKMSRIMKR